jgi:hypothetical protein
MSNILEQVADHDARFRPSTPAEYLALQLSRRLSDSAAFRHYVALFDRYPVAVLLKAYRRCVKKQEPNGPRFMAEFQQLIK